LASPALAQATRTTKSAIVRLAVCLVLVARVSALAAPPQYGLPAGNDGIPPRHTISSAHQTDGCAPAIARAELRYRLPPGLLMAIGNVESGRRSTDGRTVQPWPWTVNASGEGRYFDGMTEATTWVQERQSAGVLSIDVGCMQVNLLQHPDAFKSLASAFDPATNADYAARFLLSLYQKTGDWMTAAGFYHSQTTDIAEPYRRLVLANYHGVAASRCLPPAAALRRAWEATLVAKDGDGLASSDGPGALWRPLGVTQGSRSEGDALAGRAAPANRSGARPFVSTNSFAVGHQRCSDSAIVQPDKRSRPGSRPNQTVLVSR
jgi:hypothetical protein